jgi:acetolactate synthase I/II/III large subunit
MTFNEQITDVARLLHEARRPIFIWGAGMRPYAGAARKLARSLGIPVACTWGAIDLINHDDPLMAGGFGTHGTRAANFAVQNADLVISIGSRLDTKATGQPQDFARGACLVMVDIDHREIEKFSKLGKTIDIGIWADAGEVIDALLKADIKPPKTLDVMEEYAFWASRRLWRDDIKRWRKKYDNPVVTWPGINPYELVKEIGKYTTKEDIICSDTGTALGYLMQAFPFKGERFLHAFNMTPMGYGLPASIGASMASGRRVILVTGDGSIMMSLSELATITYWNLNIKIILLNNQGHAMCRQTQRQWLGGSYPATSVEGGLGFPNWDMLPQAFSKRWPRMPRTLKELFSDRGGFMVIDIHPDAYLIPQARFGAPIEDQEPMLDREEFKQQMIVEPI